MTTVTEVLPVSKGFHVLLCRSFGSERTSASVAFEGRSPMIGIIHVLVASILSRKTAGACLTFVTLVFGRVVIFITVGVGVSGAVVVMLLQSMFASERPIAVIAKRHDIAEMVAKRLVADKVVWRRDRER